MGKKNPNKRKTLALDMAKCHLIQGFVPFSTVGVSASRTWTYDSGKTATITYASTGVAGNSFITQVASSTAVLWKLDMATAHNNCTVVTRGEDSWTITIKSHSHTGGGVMVNENTTAKALVVLFEAGVSTMTDFKRAINTCVKCRAYGGTATAAMTLADDELVQTAINESAAVWPTTQSASQFVISAVIAGTVATYAQIAALINETTLSNKLISITSAQSGDLASALGSSVLSGGVAASALAEAQEWPQLPGPRFVATRTGLTGDGTITVTFKEQWRTCRYAKGAIKLTTHENRDCVAGIYNSTTKSITFTPFDLTATAAVCEPSPAAANGFNFISIMEE